MGLDVRTYGNIKLAENEKDADFMAYVINEDWKHKIKNLQDGKAYNGDVVFIGVSYPYSSHNRFREKLVKLVGRKDLLDSEGKIKWDELPAEIPFYDLINFADNEGCLDWEVSNTIYSDFEKYNDKAKIDMNKYDYSSYKTWLETFKSAKNNQGVVVFS
jgi:hypothetical protein